MMSVAEGDDILGHGVRNAVDSGTGSNADEKMTEKTTRAVIDAAMDESFSQQMTISMNNSFGSNADQGTGFSAEEHKMLDKILELLEEMKKDQAERNAAMEKKLEERDGAMEKEFDDLKKEIKDKEDEAWRELFTTIQLFATAISLALHLVAVIIYTWIIGIFKGFVQLFSNIVIFAIGLLHWPVHRFVVREIIRSSRRNV